MPAFQSDIMSIAERLAYYLLNGIGAQGVQLFGGCAIYEDGGDGKIDLVVTVNPGIASEFLGMVSGGTDDLASAVARTRIALRILGVDRFSIDRIRGTSEIDIFLFPPNWQLNPGAIQAALPRMSAGFVERVAREARPFSLHEMEFEPF